MKNIIKFLAAFVLSMMLMVPANAAATVLNGDEIVVVQAPEKDKKEKKESADKKACEKKCCDKEKSCDKKKEESKKEKKAEEAK
ncbi:hypothetical protein [Saccharicrinis sp. FJH54]|uniref:hypothetical protein n=1 Tax=Saccharicrinis sp. FJH54 TaxID=3344665 RepID=UPI0035D3F7D9